MRYGLLMLICLPTCGLLRRNGAHTPARASASRTRASRSGDTTRNGRFARPCNRSPSLSLRVDSCTARVTDKRRLPAYTYTPPGCSSARLVSFSWAPPRCRHIPRAKRVAESDALAGVRSKPRSASSGTGQTAHAFVSRFGEKRDSSRALHPPSAARYFVGGIPPPRLARVLWRITRTGVLPFPCARSSHMRR